MVPAEVGLRFVLVGRSSDGRRAVDGPARTLGEGRPMLGAPGVPATAQTIELVGDRTRVRTCATDSIGQRPARLRCARRPGPTRFADADARNGWDAGAAGRSVCGVRVSGRHAALSDLPPRDPWMRQAIVRMRQDRGLREASLAVRARRHGRSDWLGCCHERWTRPASDRGCCDWQRARDFRPRAACGLPCRCRGASGARRSFRPAVMVRARNRTDSRRDTPSLVTAVLTGPESRWLHLPPGDARWSWGLVLLLLIAELFVRRGPADRVAEERAARAA